MNPRQLGLVHGFHSLSDEFQHILDSLLMPSLHLLILLLHHELDSLAEEPDDFLGLGDVGVDAF